MKDSTRKIVVCTFLGAFCMLMSAILHGCRMAAFDCSNAALIRRVEADLTRKTDQLAYTDEPSYVETKYFSDLDVVDRVTATIAGDQTTLIKFGSNEASRQAYNLYINQLEDDDLLASDFFGDEQPLFGVREFGELFEQSVDNVGERAMLFYRDSYSPEEQQFRATEDYYSVKILIIQSDDYILILRRIFDLNDRIYSAADLILDSISRCAR